jgi:hypothetical protein
MLDPQGVILHIMLRGRHATLQRTHIILEGRLEAQWEKMEDC